MKTKSYLYSFGLSLCLAFRSLSVLAQAIPNVDAITFVGAEFVASNAVKTVFAVQAVQIKPDGSSAWITIGSGFFVQGVGPTSVSKSIFGVTCNHVVNALGLQTQLFVGVDLTNGYKRLPCTVLYKDSTNDIAIVLPNPGTGTNVDAQAVGLINSMYSTNSFDDGSSLVEGRGVLIVGYPLALGLKGDRNHPIVRFGMIAQNSEESSFLIDGMASHGNSGSPVVALSSHNNNLLGMVTSFQNDSIKLLDENGQLSASLPYNSGLARAVKASVILTDLNEAGKTVNF
jgi:hypothetical protein